MTNQSQTIEDKKTGTKEGQRILSFAGKDQVSYWKKKGRLRYRTYLRNGSKAKIRHLHLRVKHAGKDGWFDLETDNLDDAAIHAREIYRFVKTNGWGAANAKFKPKPALYSVSPTLSELFDAVEHKGDFSERTLASYRRKFRTIVSGICGITATDAIRFSPKKCSVWRAKVDAVKLHEITPDKVNQWRKTFIALAGKNQLKAKAAKHTADSAIRSAKALFGRKVLAKLKDFPFPPTLPFAGVAVGQIHNPYQSKIDAQALIIDAFNELQPKAPEAFKAFMLGIYAGLRRNEIDKLRWESVIWHENTIIVEAHEAFSGKTAGSEAKVPMADVLRNVLFASKPADSRGYILNSDVKPRASVSYHHYRAHRHFSVLIKWLKDKGVTDKKPIHTLRKELGKILNESLSLEKARDVLRHKDITTTARYYVSDTRDVRVTLGAVLKIPAHLLSPEFPTVEADRKPDPGRESEKVTSLAPNEAVFLVSDAGV